MTAPTLSEVLVRRSGIRAVTVVVPARDEGATIGATIASLQRAAARAWSAVGARVDALLVADSCSDDTVARAVARATTLRLRVAHVRLESAGTARSFGAARAVRDLTAAGISLDRGWIATTDADTTVPDTWLLEQLALAAAGYDGVAGTVDLNDWCALTAQAQTSYRRMLREARLGDGQHADVFGANLGVRASALARCGGFPFIEVGEDHALWNRLRRAGCRLVSPVSLSVETSSRRHGRAHGGLADLLAALELGGA